jgi:hypothetical protein
VGELEDLEGNRDRGELRAEERDQLAPEEQPEVAAAQRPDVDRGEPEQPAQLWDLDPLSLSAPAQG